jgi:LacI family transcriptional regulator
MVRPEARVLLRDVAQASDVSLSTASRALRHDPRISLETRRSVQRTARDLRYIPNLAARSLRARRTRTLGLLLTDLSDPVPGQVAAGFEKEATVHGYRVVFASGLNDPERERRALRVFIEHATDGVAIVSSVLDPRDARRRVPPSRLVIVQPDHPSILRGKGGLPPGVIQTDDAAGVAAATAHLVESGYRDIAYVGDETRASSAVRREAAAGALEALGVDRPLRWFVANDDAWRSPLEIAARILLDPPDALLCYDDKLALAVLDGLRALGVHAPGDIGIVGFDGIPFAAISNPRLTTVAAPNAELGRLAASSLVEALRGGEVPGRALMPVELVVRESTRARTPGVVGAAPA